LRILFNAVLLRVRCDVRAAAIFLLVPSAFYGLWRMRCITPVSAFAAKASLLFSSVSSRHGCERINRYGALLPQQHPNILKHRLRLISIRNVFV